MTRRWIALALVALAVLTIAPPSSRAQVPMIANGIVHATVASVNSANTTAETLLYQYQIPGALIASWTTSNRAFGSAPLHLRLNGTIRTLGNNPTATLGINLGGAGATTVVINGAALPQDLGAGTACGGAAVGFGACPAPFALDVYISPIATVTSQNCTDLRPCNQSMYLAARAVMATTTQGNAIGGVAASETSFNSASISQANINQAMTLNVLWRWGAAASGNSLNIYNGTLKLGF